MSAEVCGGCGVSRWGEPLPPSGRAETSPKRDPEPECDSFQLAEPDTRRIVNRSATAFRIAASTLRLSDSYLGAQFRRFRSKLGAPKAITAMAHKLAVLFYRMLRLGNEYVDRGVKVYEERYRQQQLSLLNKRAAQLDSPSFRRQPQTVSP